MPEVSWYNPVDESSYHISICTFCHNEGRQKIQSHRIGRSLDGFMFLVVGMHYTALPIQSII